MIGVISNQHHFHKDHRNAMNRRIAMKWTIVQVERRRYSIHRPGSDLPPFTILLEEPMTEENLKIIASAKSNLEKVNAMPEEVLEDLWRATYIEKYFLAKSGA